MDASETRSSDLLRSRLNASVWGLLLAWTGAMLLAPGELETLWHVWLLGVGVILVAVGLVAVSLGVRPDPDTWIFGAVGLVSGAAGLAGIPVSAIGLALLLFGLVFIASVARAALFGTRPLSGESRRA